MKVKVNAPCPCGSGKKYKKCCMNSGAVIQQNIAQELQNTLLMHPDLSADDLQVVLDNKVKRHNEQSIEDFCGLSAEIMHSWINAKCNEALNVRFNAPQCDTFHAPILAYVEVFFTDIIENGGKLKATTKGNLPTKTVKKAAALLPDLVVAKYEKTLSVSEFSGGTEDKFNAMHVTHILLQQSGFIKLQKGVFSLTKKGKTLYQSQGLHAFFVPLLRYYIDEYNWGYLDGYSDDAMISMCWAFSFWRLQQHGNVEQLGKEINTAFPWLAKELPHCEYSTQEQQLQSIIEVRLINRFMTLFGFTLIDPCRYQNGKKLPLKLELQPLFTQVVQFDGLP